MDRFIKMARLEDSELLQHLLRHDHHALVLLIIIAQRARRAVEPHPATGRRRFEAEIGDYARCGLSRQHYRTALKHLEKWKIVTIKPTTKGTIVTLCNGSVFDINPEGANHQANQQLTINQPTPNQRLTTKKNDKKEKNGKNERKSSAYTASADAGSTGSGEASYCGLKGEPLQRFNQYWKAFDYKRGKAEAARAWKKLEPVAVDLFKAILEGARQAAGGRGALVESGQTPKMAQGWITGRRWEDEALGYSNQTGDRKYDKARDSKQTARKADSVGRASGSGLPLL